MQRKRYFVTVILLIFLVSFSGCINSGVHSKTRESKTEVSADAGKAGKGKTKKHKKHKNKKSSDSKKDSRENKESSKSPESSEEVQTETREDGQIIVEKEFGSFTLPKGWVEATEHEENGRYFYVKDGNENDAAPNNISVNKAKFRYTLEEVDEFTASTTWQLGVQAEQAGIDAKITGYGMSTDEGDVVCCFEVKDENSTEVIRQYYILRDKEFVMVYLTNHDEDKDADAAAELIVKSFKWK